MFLYLVYERTLGMIVSRLDKALCRSVVELDRQCLEIMRLGTEHVTSMISLVESADILLQGEKRMRAVRVSCRRAHFLMHTHSRRLALRSSETSSADSSP